MDLRFGSLRARVLVLATVPLLGMIVTLLVLGHRAAERTLTANVRESLDNAGLVLRETVRARREALLAQARVTASDPRFFATFSVPQAERGAEFAPTLAGVARDFLAITDADFLEIFDARGHRLARQGRPAGSPAWSDEGPGRSSLDVALAGSLSADHFATDSMGLLVIDVPVFVAGHLEAVLRMGRGFDAIFAAELSRMTGAAVAVSSGTRVLVASGDATSHADDHALRLPIALESLSESGGLTAVLTRDLDQQLRPLAAAERVMILLGLVALLATIGASVAIAEGVTRPLRRVVEAAGRLREGDYDARLQVNGRDEVAHLARSFEAMRTDLAAYVTHLRDIDAIKSDFLALAGHELKTPLTVIISFNDLIQSGALGELPEEILETNGIIKSQLSRLDSLVQDILDLSALETKGADALYHEELDLGTLARDVVLAQEGARAERVLDVCVPASTSNWPVRGDERLLTRAIRALLDNAVRFTPDGGRIEVRVEGDSESIRLCVHDSGVGIAPEEQRWIAGKFYERGDIAHHSSGDLEFASRGLGLGLALTRAIVEAHGGRLHFTSRPGQGSVFTLEVPKGPRHDAQGCEHIALPDHAPPPEVLA